MAGPLWFPALLPRLPLLPGVGKAAAERFEKLLEPWLSQKGNGGKMVAKPNESDTRLGGFEPTTLGSEDRCSVR